MTLLTALTVLALSITNPDTTRSAPAPIPRFAAQQVGLSNLPLPPAFVINDAAGLRRRRGASWYWVGFGAFVGTAFGAALWEIKRDSDNGRDASPWMIVPYTLVGASIGFMGSSK